MTKLSSSRTTRLAFLVNAIIAAVMLLSATFLSSPAFSAIEEVQFDEPKLHQRYQSLISELRCLVCQNQNLADSDAGLAKDLRKKTEEMLKAGNTDQQILEYMRERYGDFVLYRPPFSLATSLLWLGPLVLLLLVIIAVFLNVRKRNKLQTERPSIDQQQRDKVRRLLDK